MSLRNSCMFSLIVLLIFAHASSGAELTQRERRSLSKRNVVSNWVRSEDGIPGIQVSIIVEATRDRIWSTLTDYENYTRIFDGIKSMCITDQSDEGATVQFSVDAVIKELNYVLRRSYVQPGYTLSWRKVSGDLDDIRGSWIVEDTEDSGSKLLIYDSYVDVGFPINTWLVRLVAGRKAKQMARKLRDWIEFDTPELQRPPSPVELDCPAP